MSNLSSSRSTPSATMTTPMNRRGLARRAVSFFTDQPLLPRRLRLFDRLPDEHHASRNAKQGPRVPDGQPEQTEVHGEQPASQNDEPRAPAVRVRLRQPVESESDQNQRPAGAQRGKSQPFEPPEEQQDARRHEQGACDDPSLVRPARSDPTLHDRLLPFRGAGALPPPSD